MGIFDAVTNSISGAAAEQWKDFFVCDEMGNDVLMKRGIRETNGNGGSSIITDGSIIVVGEGECAVVTEGGKIIGVYDEPGEQVFGSTDSRGIFTGGLKAFAKDVGHRISFGGDAPVMQKLYYINTKELQGSDFVAEGVPVHFRDKTADVDLDGSVRCSGTYTFRITSPERFYKVAIRAESNRSREQLLEQMNTELLTVIETALSALLEEGIRPSELPQYTKELSEKLKLIVSEEWHEVRGIEACSVAIDSLTVLDGEMIQMIQRDTAFCDPLRAAAHLVGSAGDAMQSAAENTGAGAGVAVMLQSQFSEEKESWKCSCGAVSNEKFCMMCGRAKPEEWYCVCGTANKGKFCVFCGKPKSAEWKCSCGTINAGNFCENCGKPR